MSRVFFISDLHFGHKNLASVVRKMSVEDNDNLIISNWNKTVNKKDTVYVLGDLTMENYKLIEPLISQLKGNITIIGGNHDDKRCCRELCRLGIITMGALEYKGFICTHIPVHRMEVSGRYRGNIHGHIHTRDIDYGNLYFNVCCELINYTPILFDKLVELFLKKQNDSDCSTLQQERKRFIRKSS